MLRKLVTLFFAASVLSMAPSCKSNKMPCPTYADSTPQKKGKKGKQEPQIPRASKPKSGILPPNAKKVKRKPE